MKKALVITYYWPSAGGSGVQRWLKFVKYFRDFDIEPVVYTVKNPSYPIIDNSLKAEVPKNIELLSKPIWEPNNMLSFFGRQKKESAGFLNPNPSFIGNLLQYIRANYFIPDARKFWVKPSVNYLKKYLKINKIDVIITTGPPHSVHLIGLKLKRELKVKWIADFRDPWTEIDYFHKLPLTKKSFKKHYSLEKEVLENADTVLVVGKTMNENYKQFNKNVVTITNGFDGKISKEKNKTHQKFCLTHVGLLNADRNSELLWEVLSEICRENSMFERDFEMKFIGKVDTSVHKSITNFKLEKNVHFLGYKSHSEVNALQYKSQVLILIVNNVPSAKGIVTGKIFEYLKVRKPILAIAPVNGDLAEIVTQTQSGYVIDFNDKVGLKNTILELYAKFKEGKLTVNSKNIEQYHRKELTKKVSEIINNLTE